MIAVVVVVAAIGLVASEGARFDGYAQMWPGHPVHLRMPDGRHTVVALAELTRAHVDTTLEAKVMDDEGYGIRRLESVLDCRGLAFKLDMGTMAFRRGNAVATGTVGDFAMGLFVSPSFGILFGATLGGATDGVGDVITRHAFFAELQSMPLSVGRRLHVGGYAHGGMAMAATTAAGGSAETGPAFGGGALVELDLTGRLALSLRAGANAAQLETTGWSPAATATLGLAVY